MRPTRAGQHRLSQFLLARLALELEGKRLLTTERGFGVPSGSACIEGDRRLVVCDRNSMEGCWLDASQDVVESSVARRHRMIAIGRQLALQSLDARHQVNDQPQDAIVGVLSIHERPRRLLVEPLGIGLA
jgi:hypothetical protein